MQIDELKELREKLYQIASRHGIRRVYVFGSIARGESTESSDVDFLIELEEGASAFGVGAFQYEVQQLLGIPVDVIPTFALPRIEDKTFVQAVKSGAVAI